MQPRYLNQMRVDQFERIILCTNCKQKVYYFKCIKQLIVSPTFYFLSLFILFVHNFCVLIITLITNCNFGL